MYERVPVSPHPYQHLILFLLFSHLSHIWLFWDPMNCSLPGSSVLEISWARILLSITISFFRGSSWSRDQTQVSCLVGGFFTTESPGKPCQLNISESEVAQLCPPLCDPMNCSLPGSSVHGIFQARILEWVAISFSRRSSPTQGSNPGLPHCRQTLYCLNHQEVFFNIGIKYRDRD